MADCASERKKSSPTRDGTAPLGRGRGNEPSRLGPCRICGAPATGFHYGVNSCEPCKGFYRRTLVRKEPYTCVKNKKCQIENGIRNPCPQCRYEKCIRVGMSVEAIKIGRYTNEKRTRDLQDVIRANTTDACAPTGISEGMIVMAEDRVPSHENLGNQPLDYRITRQDSISSSHSPESADISVSPAELWTTSPGEYARCSTRLPSTEDDEMEDAQDLSFKPGGGCYSPTGQGTQCGGHCIGREDLRHSGSNEASQGYDTERNDEQESEGYYRGTPGTYLHKVSVLHEKLPDFTSYPAEEIDRMRHFMSVIHYAYKIVTPSDEEIMSYPFQNLQLDKPEYYLPDEDAIDMDEFIEIYSRTGQQVDDRVSLLPNWIEGANYGVQCLVTFARHITGFIDFSKRDQVAIIKGCLTVSWIIAVNESFVIPGKLFISAESPTRIHVMELRKYLSKRTANHVIKAVQHVKDLNFTREQTAYFTCAMLFVDDNRVVENQSLMLELQERYWRILFYSVYKSQRDLRDFFPRLCRTLYLLQQAQELYQAEEERRVLVLEDGNVLFARNVPMFLAG